MRKRIGVLVMLVLLCLTGWCQKAAGGEAGASYAQIDQETAKEMMARDDGHLLVDVRRPDEYEAGHIPGAICIPNESIGKEPPEALADKEQVILIYCRSGNRSKQAAGKLAQMGYENIFEFGGILDWDGEIVTGAEDVTGVEEATGVEDAAGATDVTGMEEGKEDLSLEKLVDFYYTYDSSTAVPLYQRYRFYVEEDGYFFSHETREGGGWPQGEESIAASGTKELTDEQWQSFLSCLEGGKIALPSDEVIDGDPGPWTYVYRGNGQEEYVFASYDARKAFEKLCEELSS